jgi:hypothetical protein
MKRSVFLVIAVLVLAVVSLPDGTTDAKPRRFRAKKIFKPVTVNLPDVDRVDIHRLKFQEHGRDPVIATRQLTGEEAQKLATMWRTLTYLPVSADCHFPRHAITFKKGDTVVAEASICFECNNISFQTPQLFPTDGIGTTLGFDNQDAVGKKFQALFENSFPNQK